MADLRTFTLWARKLLTLEAGNLLEQVYRLDAKTGARLPIPNGHPLETNESAAYRHPTQNAMELR